MATRHVNGVLRHLRTAARVGDNGGPTDGQLLSCYIAGRDESAFAALVRRHGPMVLGVCRRVLRHGQDAEDAFQATWLVLARKAASLRRRELVGNWLYGVAYRAALEVRAGRRKGGEPVNELPEPAVVDESAVWRDLRPVLDQELSRLPEKYRVPVVLCDLEGRTRREAARQLGIPEGTLSGRLTTARRTLARRLGRRGLALSGGALAAALAHGAASAGVPPSLAVSAVRSATAVAGESTAAVAVSARVTTITEGVLKTMLLTKLKALGTILLACLTLGGLALTATLPAAAREQQGAAPAAPAAARPVAEAPRQGKGFFAGKTDLVYALAFSPNDQVLASGGDDFKVRLWELRTRQVIRILDGPQGQVRAVRFSPDGRTLAAGADDGVIYFWDVPTGKRKGEVTADLPKKLAAGKPLAGAVFVNSLVFLPGGKLAAVYQYLHREQDTWHSRVVLWDRARGTAETLHEERGHSSSLALSPDGKALAATLWGDSHGFKVWDLKGRKVIWEGQAGPDFMSAVAFAPDGKKLVAGGGHSVEVQGGFRVEGRLWLFDVETRKQLWHVKAPDNWAYSRLAFTADGSGVLTGSSGPIRPFRVNGAQGSKVVSELRRWDAATGKVVWKAEGEFGSIQGLAVSADGRTVAASDDEQLMLFDPEQGKRRAVLPKVWR